MSDNNDSGYELFEPYERLVSIEIEGVRCSVPENNTILRCLQFLEMEKISEAELCWNADCMNCQVWIEQGGKEKAVIACRTRVEEGMKILRLHPAIA